jgi:hypothetical protein
LGLRDGREVARLALAGVVVLENSSVPPCLATGPRSEGKYDWTADSRSCLPWQIISGHLDTVASIGCAPPQTAVLRVQEQISLSQNHERGGRID